jgi:hypothetical protein
MYRIVTGGVVSDQIAVVVLPLVLSLLARAVPGSSGLSVRAA